MRLACTCLLLTACPPGDADSDATATVGTTAAGSDATPTTDGAPTTGEAPGQCLAGGLGPAFAWVTAPEPGAASCTRITDDLLALDCSGDFTGIFTLELSNPGAPGIMVGEALAVDYHNTRDGDVVTGEWLRVRGSNQWYIVAGQGPTLAPPAAPADWFHPNVEVAVVDPGCAAVACADVPADTTTPRAISFGAGDLVHVLAPGEDGGVPGEFGGESYHAAVSEAHTGVCGEGTDGAAVDVLAFSVVSSGFL